MSSRAFPLHVSEPAPAPALSAARPRLSAVVPSRRSIAVLAGLASIALAALLLRAAPIGVATQAALGTLVLVAAAMLSDAALSVRAWRRAPPKMTRRLPSALAVGVRQTITLAVANEGPHAWQCVLHDGADASLATEGLPIPITLNPSTEVELSYGLVPMRRGDVAFAPAQVLVSSRWGLCELVMALGAVESRRVYPDFSQVARYAWLAGDRRLQEIGVKTFQMRGEGTDFKQLSEYRIGDSVRHIDWRASLRLAKPIVREFQDERDQCVLLLIDCGRRMRADDRDRGIGTTHFDQVLNAVMLLAYVALQQGDAVGAMTFGTPRGEERALPPGRGIHTLHTLMSGLYDVQPSPTHSDYVTAAQDLVGRYRKRALVVVITNFRDEDSPELRRAISLLRTRHLVLTASVREKVVAELIAQPVTEGTALDIASAHLYEQSRRDAFNRLAVGGAVVVDAEPERLGVDLVNRYHAMKRAGTI